MALGFITRSLSSKHIEGAGSDRVCGVLGGSKDATTLSMFRNLRELQKRILKVLVSLDYAPYLREIASMLGIDKRRVLDALNRLVRRGVVEKLDGGRYRVRPDLKHIVMHYLDGKDRSGSKDARGTGVPGAGSRVSVCVRLDNVRGFVRVLDGYRYYPGDRYGDRDPSFLGYLDRVSYFEVSLKFATGGRNECFIAIYYRERDGAVVVEFRPYAGDPDVRRGDWRKVMERGVLDLLRWALRALKAAVRELGLDIFAKAVELIKEELGTILIHVLCHA